MKPSGDQPLIIISGPSGAGKSTLVRRLLRDCALPLELSISATTRDPRRGEIHGRDYYFLTEAEFKKRRDAGHFIECKEVFGRGHWYGTLRDVVSSGWKRGKWVILEIDVEGARTVLESFPDAISIFVHPGSIDELQKRLVARGSETPESIARRLEVAAQEMKQKEWYRHEVINRNVEQAVNDLCDLLESYRKESD
jgi:guanylate kinase